MKNEILIEVSHLYKAFGKLLAVNDVSLEIKAGEIFGLVGSDGAGKTTTMRLLCGAYTPSRPNNNQVTKIRVGGCDVITQTEYAREKIGYLPQRFSLYDELTVLENIRFFSETRGLRVGLETPVSGDFGVRWVDRFHRSQSRSFIWRYETEIRISCCIGPQSKHLVIG